MTNWKKVAAWWESKHLGNCFVTRRREGWVVELGHSEGITEPSAFLVPVTAADGHRRRQLAGRLRGLLVSTVTGLGDVRRLEGRQVEKLLCLPRLGPLWRKGGRSSPPSTGNWNGRGRLCPMSGQSGFTYLVARTDGGWMVLLRSLWGTPCGSYLVPFDKVPFGGKRWDADFFLRPLRWHLSHMQGARRLSSDELDRLHRVENDMLDDLRAA